MTQRKRPGDLLLKAEAIGVKSLQRSIEVPSGFGERLGSVLLRRTGDELMAAFIDPRDEQGWQEAARVTGRRVRCRITPGTTTCSAIMRTYPPTTRGGTELPAARSRHTTRRRA